MKKINKKQAGIILLSLLSINSFAQKIDNDSTLNRTVVVEQEYNPDILDASKINILPKVEEPTVAKKEIEYSIVSMPLSSFDTYQEMAPFTYPEKQQVAKRGFVRLGYGNYGNMDGKLNYLFRLSSKDQLGVAAGIDGMKGKLEFGDGKHRLHYYHSMAKIDYLHQFDRVDMDIAGRWGLSNFNYQPLAPLTHQRFTSGDIHLGVKSTDEMLPVNFDVETNLLLFSRAHNWTGIGAETDKVNESRIYTNANIKGNINEEQQVGIALQMNNLFYTEGYQDNYTSLQLNPYYEFDNEDWKLHLGVNADLSLGLGKTVQVSPDITIQYVFSDSYVLYAKATGGRQVNDFRKLEQFCPYAELLKGEKIDNTYEQINASLGFRASPYPGVWFHLFGGYQNLKDDLYQLNDVLIEGVSSPFISIGQENSSNVYGGANISYGYRDLLNISAEGVYRHWNMSDEALFFKPAFLLNLKMDIHPLKALTVNVGYQYLQREKVVNERIASINNLYAGATYDIYKGLSAYVKLDNLLNKQYSYYWSYPLEKFNFIAGISYRF